MGSSIRVRRDCHEYGLTTLELSGNVLDVEIRILTKLGKRERRVIIRTFLAQIKPWLRYFSKTGVDHAQHGLVLNTRAIHRGANTFQTRPVTSFLGNLGFTLRMERLKRGLSQNQLAQAFGMSRAHLSQLERGCHLPQRSTLKKIETFLSQKGTPPDRSV